MGVPMIVYPFDVTDQHGAAARVNYHKLGIVGDRHQDDSNTVRSHVERIIGDTQYFSRVQKMREYFERNLSENRAVNAVKAIIAQSGSSNQ
jgi:UDP:flavonoid glycosyltransferase YjiC (YdhE family)